MISNYHISKKRLAEGIDRTVAQSFRTEKIERIEDVSKSFEIARDNLLSEMQKKIRRIYISATGSNHISENLGILKKVPKIYERFESKKEVDFHKNVGLFCDCCGEVSYSPYCEKCSFNHDRSRLSWLIENKEYSEAFRFALQSSKEKYNKKINRRNDNEFRPI